MSSSIRGVHVSPGIYTKETELTFAAKSLGITTLGVVGETQRGPAFEPVRVENWREFQSIFGGTSTEKFKGSQYPKYELPYIAKSYLSESNQLEVCRVLGLSGYNAGPAWIITLSGSGEYNSSALAVIRSRGYYEPYHKMNANAKANEDCGCGSNVKYDYQRFYVGELEDPKCTEAGVYSARKFVTDGKAIKLTQYTPIDSFGDECKGYNINAGTPSALASICSADNYGKFNIEVWLSGNYGTTYDANKPDYKYAVSLNPNDKDYILKVLGTNNDDGSAPIYVETLYDVALEQGIINGMITGINTEPVVFAPTFFGDYCTIAPVNDILLKPEGSLTRSDVGKRFLASKESVDNTIHYNVIKAGTTNVLAFTTDKDGKVTYTTSAVTAGDIYLVKQFTLADGKRKYFYVKTKDSLKSISGYDTTLSVTSGSVESGVVKCLSDGLYYRKITNDVAPITVDFNNYKSSYTFASTPWFVSNVKGDYKNLEVNRLFRFHTISDGNSSNYEIKVSIENILPDEGYFDVVVRAINDRDDAIMPLEKFSRCNLVPGDSHFIGFRIGTSDGEYESQSKYITVELYGDGVIHQNSVPAGFMGYPHGFYYDGYTLWGQNKVKAPVLLYNCNFDEDIKNRKQYFGLSSITGVDVDAFTFKGLSSYVELPKYLTKGFHLDCRLNPIAYGVDGAGVSLNSGLTITVDGETGYSFDTTSVNSRTLIYDNSPIIGTEEEMLGSIFEDVKLRKFTAYFYGGFDGWDAYRKERTITDDFKMVKYRGEYNDISGEGYAFDRINNPELIGLNQNGITSDWYAYLSAIRQFANPEAVDINIFATPGIDLVNNTLLAQEVIEMIEEERADSIYVATIPDKPKGASDYVDEMYSAEDIVEELEGTEIDSNYTCTYYPWVKFYDVDNNQYIYLPATKDVVRNMAQTDNQSYSWFPPAGLDRGDVQAVRAHYVTRLADEDTLYENRINPVKTFSQDGLKIWGQKNLQKEEGQLNRIAVRRLLLRMRKLISIACLSLIFQPNDEQTKQSLQSLITPIMDNIRSNRGISDYKVEINSSNATLEDRRELNVRILFKPYAALEYINIEFAVTPEGVAFEDL